MNKYAYKFKNIWYLQCIPCIIYCMTHARVCQDMTYFLSTCNCIYIINLWWSISKQCKNSLCKYKVYLIWRIFFKSMLIHKRVLFLWINPKKLSISMEQKSCPLIIPLRSSLTQEEWQTAQLLHPAQMCIL